MENKGPSFRETVGHGEMEKALSPYVRNPEAFVQAMVYKYKRANQGRIKGVDHDELVLEAYEKVILDCIPKLKEFLLSVNDDGRDKGKLASTYLGQHIYWVLNNYINANCKQKVSYAAEIGNDDANMSEEEILDQIVAKESPLESEEILNGLDQEEMLGDLVNVIKKSTDEKTSERYIAVLELIMEGLNTNDITRELGYADNKSVTNALDRIRKYLLNDPEFVSKWGAELPYTDPSTRFDRPNSTNDEARLFTNMIREIDVKTVPLNFDSIPLDQLGITIDDMKPDASMEIRKKISNYIDDYLQAEFDAKVSRSTRWRIVQKLLEREDASAQIGRRKRMERLISEETINSDETVGV